MRTNILVPVFSMAFFLSFMFMGVLSADASVTHAMLFHNGSMVGTVAVPAPLPHGGIDPLYKVTNGVSGQLGIASVAPGDTGYHGGAWAVYSVTFNASTTPYLLTSLAEVQAAQTAGDVTVTRAPDLDNRCTVQL